MSYKSGFYTALGTPLDSNGNLVEKSLRKHIGQQIDAGASGLLLMGSMGIEAYVKNSAYKEIVMVGADEVGCRVPLFVGIMDNSVAKVTEKLEMTESVNIDGVVLTTPFYSAVNNKQMVNWFSSIADKSVHPLYLYDLAVVTKSKITMSVIDKIINHPNIKGIKTADWEMIKAIERKYPDAVFECFYSGLDSFDYANMIGIDKNLDGMFSCTPKCGRTMYDCIKNGDYTGARENLDKILYLRNTMIKYDLMPCFTHCMNLIGCEGSFHQDYCLPLDNEAKEAVKDVMIKIGEI